MLAAKARQRKGKSESKPYIYLIFNTLTFSVGKTLRFIYACSLIMSLKYMENSLATNYHPGTMVLKMVPESF